MKKKLRYCTPQLHKLNDLKNLVCTDGSSADTPDPTDCSGGQLPDTASTAYCFLGSGAAAAGLGCRPGAAAAPAGTCTTGYDVGSFCGIGTGADDW